MSVGEWARSTGRMGAKGMMVQVARGATSKGNAGSDGTTYAVAGTALVMAFVMASALLLVVPGLARDPSQRDEGFLLAIDQTTFPDSRWRSYVRDVIDTDRDGCLSVPETDAVTKIGEYDAASFEVIEQGVSQRSIDSLEGIEYFPQLSMLVAENNNISELDISRNPRLLCIDMRGNPHFDLRYSQQNEQAQVLVDGDAQVVTD